MKTYKVRGGRVVRADCLKVLPKIPDESADLVFADPPFNIGYAYDEYKDKVSPSQYLDWSMQWIEECDRILKPTGSMFVAIGDEYAAEMKLLLDDTMTMRNWIIWTYNFGVNCKYKFGRDHTHVLYYVKAGQATKDSNRKFKFYRERILEPSARQTKYKDQRAELGGRVPGDVWNFSRVCGTFKERNKFGHKCQMPEAILERIIKVTTDKGDFVVDPFGGTGTTAAVAQRLKRKFLTCELSKNYTKGILERLR